MRRFFPDRGKCSDCAAPFVTGTSCTNALTGSRSPARVITNPFASLLWISTGVNAPTSKGCASASSDRGHDLFDAGRAGIDRLVIAEQDDSPRPLLALIERSESRSLAGLMRRSLEGIDPLVTDAVLLAVTRAHERLSITERLHVEGFPLPQRLLTWGRLVVAAHMREDRHRSAARTLGVLRGMLGDRAGAARKLRHGLSLFSTLGAKREAKEIGILLQRPTPARSLERIVPDAGTSEAP